MIKRFICYWIGHKWQQKGAREVKSFLPDREMPYQVFDTFLFFCPRCHCFKETTLKHSYAPCNYEEEEVEIDEK